MPNSDSNLGLAANLDTEVGKVVIELGLATRTEVEFCREQQKQSEDCLHVDGHQEQGIDVEIHRAQPH